MQDDTKQIVPEEETIAKYTIKDSVFSDLFKIKKYLLQLYRALHPEDKTATESELTDITIKNVLTDGIYNDLGFLFKEKLIFMIRAQSTWTVNILVRVVLYFAKSYQDYIIRTGQDIYGSKKVELPKPEIYVIYTGSRKARPETISLAEEFFPGGECCLNVTVRMIYDGKKGDIIDQYVSFTKVFDEQVKKYGLTIQAARETIRICKDRDVLREYL